MNKPRVISLAFSGLLLIDQFVRKGLNLIQRILDEKIGQANALMSDFKLGLNPIHTIREMESKAEKVVNLCNQFGEGWLLPADIVAMAESGIRNILGLQPFGCIANHIVAKGIAKKLTSLYHDLNFLSLDMDAGNSDANIQNRLALFIHPAKD